MNVDSTVINKTKTLNILIGGLVQGVGFRPFIYKLALQHQLKGWVRNSFSGVEIHVDSYEHNISDFIQAIYDDKPKAAHINAIQINLTSHCGYDDFKINTTKNETENAVTHICPDIDVCEDCLQDLKFQPHRINYSFINCTNCGPRFSILSALPYDRKSTSMNTFEMCNACKDEYTDVLDRRYHAQPIACNACGPAYTYISTHKRICDFSSVLTQVTKDLSKGEIVAVKGVGGYNLICDASNEDSIQQLRKIKSRDSKPFAVMFPSVSELKKYAFATEHEITALQSWRKPIIILDSMQILSDSISGGFSTLGAILPYLPLHHLLLEKYAKPIVFTSANFTNEPIIIGNENIHNKAFNTGFSIVEHNRDIVNRVDDSVVKIVSNVPRIIRRSRGYVPEPIDFTIHKTQNILGVGAELSSSFAIGLKKSIVPGQFIGDIKNVETLTFYEDSYHRFCQMYHFTPELVAHDLHPDYLSTQFAKTSGITTLAVQHHHAHIASCMAENGESNKVIGVCFDGTGLGTDGNIWGSEFMIADYAGFERLYALDYVSISGGDSIIKDTWKTALSYLYALGLRDEQYVDILPFYNEIPGLSLNNYQLGLQNNINTHKSCGMGRLFDAVAAITGVCSKAGFNGEAPMRLENIINKAVKDAYSISTKNDKIVLEELFRQLIMDIKNNISVDIISTRFHNTIINMTCKLIEGINQNTGINKVVLSGGVFQNAYLLGNIEERLKATKLDVLQHRKLPYNDGNIAVGQVAIASNMLT